MDEASFKREDYLLFLMTEYSQLKLLGTTKIRKRPRNKGHEKLPRTGPYPEDKNEKSPSPNAQKNPLSAGARPYLRFFIVQRISWGGGDVHCPGTIPFPANNAVCPARSHPSCVQNFIFSLRKYGQMAY